MDAKQNDPIARGRAGRSLAIEGSLIHITALASKRSPKEWAPIFVFVKK
jgi:hypothetical protein